MVPANRAIRSHPLFRLSSLLLHHVWFTSCAHSSSPRDGCRKPWKEEEEEEEGKTRMRKEMNGKEGKRESARVMIIVHMRILLQNSSIVTLCMM